MVRVNRSYKNEDKDDLHRQYSRIKTKRGNKEMRVILERICMIQASVILHICRPKEIISLTEKRKTGKAEKVGGVMEGNIIQVTVSGLAWLTGRTLPQIREGGRR